MKSARRRIIEGCITNSAGKLFLKFFSFVSFIIIIKHISLNDYGLLNLLFSVIGPSVAFTMIGLETLIVADAAFYRGQQEIYKARKLLVDYFKTILFLSILLFIFSWLFKDFLSYYYKFNVNYYWPLFILVIGQISMNYISITFDAYEKFSYSALFQFGESFFRFILIISLLFFGFSLYSILWVYAGAKILVSSFGFFYSMSLLGRKEKEITENYIFYTIKRHGKWELIRNIPARVINNIWPWMLRIVSGNEAVGLFAFSQKIYSFVVGVIPLNSILFPVICSSLGKDKNIAFIIIAKAKKYLFILYTLIYIGIFILIKPLINLFAPEYLGSIFIIKVLMLDLYNDVISVGQSAIIYAYKKQKINLVITIINEIIQLLSQFIFSYLFKAVGLALSSLLTGFSAYILRNIVLRKNLKINLHLKFKEIFRIDEYDRMILEKFKYYFIKSFNFFKI
jgi:O-antigen/teichoic acid export membrane protein